MRWFPQDLLFDRLTELALQLGIGSLGVLPHSWNWGFFEVITSIALHLDQCFLKKTAI
jgi:hypothetical protein